MMKKITLVAFVICTGLTIQAAFFMFGGGLDLNNLYNYANQDIPEYVTQNTTPPDNQITDEIATLGRVLFHDKKLSLNESISCESCHRQEFAFGDTAALSKGFDGELTERHAMRLINVSHRALGKVFWDNRGASLEDQPGITIANSVEMGFSGEQGQPSLDSLLNRLRQQDYYSTLFDLAYGNEEITLEKINKALAQFVRTLISFDSKFDEGLAATGNPNVAFPNFNNLENYGKSIFISPFPQIVSPFEEAPDSVFIFGCSNCHNPPTFTQSEFFEGNNGVTSVAGDTTQFDFTNVNSPSIRNVFKANGEENGPYMHDGSLKDLDAVLEHYAFIPFNPENESISIGVSGLPFDARRPMSDYQVSALKAFMKTLTGNDIFTNPKWSDPFDINGELVFAIDCTGAVLTTNQSETICEGDNLEGYTETGTYTDSFIGINGCDSIRTLNLVVLPTVSENITASVCDGEVYEGYDSAGSYTDFFIGVNGCDSIRVLDLEIVPLEMTSIEVSICEGEEYNGLSESGVYEQLVSNLSGCDSLIIINLTVLPEGDPSCTMTGTEALSDVNFLQAFPNPSSSFFYIDFMNEADYTWQAVNSIGKNIQLKVDKITNKRYQIDLGENEVGIYFIQYREKMNKEWHTLRLIKS